MASQSDSPVEEKKSESVLTPREAKIFVSVVNYRDIEGQYTLKNLFEKAKHPERVYVGYCFQYDPSQDGDCHTHYLPLVDSRYGRNIRTLFISHKQARGPMFARHLVQKQLYDNEHFYLQVDSHMRFVKDWDSILIRMWEDCRDANAIITTYPNGYDELYRHKVRDFVSRQLSKEAVSKEEVDAFQVDVKEWDGELNMRQLDKRPALLCAREFGEDGFLRISAKPLSKKLSRPIPSLFWAAGFSFSSGRVVNDVPYDPKMKCLFFGEESVMAARLYTNGYNFFCPPVNIVYHLYDRNNSPFRKGVWRDLFAGDGNGLEAIEAQSQNRARQLLSGESMLYGLGIQRTVEEYQTFCGVNFATREISEKGQFGGLEGSERQLFVETKKEQQFNAVMNILGAIRESIPLEDQE